MPHRPFRRVPPRRPASAARPPPSGPVAREPDDPVRVADLDPQELALLDEPGQPSFDRGDAVRRRGPGQIGRSDVAVHECPDRSGVASHDRLQARGGVVERDQDRLGGRGHAHDHQEDAVDDEQENGSGGSNARSEQARASRASARLTVFGGAARQHRPNVPFDWVLPGPPVPAPCEPRNLLGRRAAARAALSLAGDGDTDARVRPIACALPSARLYDYGDCQLSFEVRGLPTGPESELDLRGNKFSPSAFCFYGANGYMVVEDSGFYFPRR